MSEWVNLKSKLPPKSALIGWVKMYRPSCYGIQKSWISKVDDIGWANDYEGYHVETKNMDADFWYLLPDTPK